MTRLLISTLAVGALVRVLGTYTVTNNAGDEVTTEPGDTAHVFAIDQNPKPQGRTLSLIVRGGEAAGGVLVFDEQDTRDADGVEAFAPLYRITSPGGYFRNPGEGLTREPAHAALYTEEEARDVTRREGSLSWDLEPARADDPTGVTPTVLECIASFPSGEEHPPEVLAWALGCIQALAIRGEAGDLPDLNLLGRRLAALEDFDGDEDEDARDILREEIAAQIVAGASEDADPFARGEDGKRRTPLPALSS